MDIKVLASAVAAASVVGLAGVCDAGVVHKVTLEGELALLAMAWQEAEEIAAIADASGLELICHAGMNTPYGQHFTYASTNSRWGEFFVGGAPGQPLKETNNYPGMAVPENGQVVVSDEPGFGHGLSMKAIEGMAV